MNFFCPRDYRLLGPIETSPIGFGFSHPRRDCWKPESNIDGGIQIRILCETTLTALELLQSSIRLLNPPATGTSLRGVGWVHGLYTDTVSHGSILQLAPDERVCKRRERTVCPSPTPQILDIFQPQGLDTGEIQPVDRHIYEVITMGLGAGEALASPATPGQLGKNRLHGMTVPVGGHALSVTGHISLLGPNIDANVSAFCAQGRLGKLEVERDSIGSESYSAEQLTGGEQRIKMFVAFDRKNDLFSATNGCDGKPHVEAGGLVGIHRHKPRIKLHVDTGNVWLGDFHGLKAFYQKIFLLFIAVFMRIFDGFLRLVPPRSRSANNPGRLLAYTLDHSGRQPCVLLQFIGDALGRQGGNMVGVPEQVYGFSQNPDIFLVECKHLGQSVGIGGVQ